MKQLPKQVLLIDYLLRLLFRLYINTRGGVKRTRREKQIISYVGVRECKENVRCRDPISSVLKSIRVVISFYHFHVISLFSLSSSRVLEEEDFIALTKTITISIHCEEVSLHNHSVVNLPPSHILTNFHGSIRLGRIVLSFVSSYDKRKNI